MIFQNEPEQIASKESELTARIMGTITIAMILLMGALFFAAAIVRVWP